MASDDNPFIRVRSGSGNNDAGFDIYHDASLAWRIWNNGGPAATPAEDALIFNSGAGGVGEANALLAILPTGLIGINTDNPSNILHAYRNDTNFVQVIAEQANSGGSSAGFKSVADGAEAYFIQFCTATAGTYFGINRADSALFGTWGSTNMFVGTLSSTPLYLGTNDTLAMLMDTNQDVIIGWNTAQVPHKLEVNGSAGKSAGGTTWAVISDQKYKEEIETIQNALDRLSQLRGVTFKWKQNAHGRLPGVQAGVISQEVEQVFPEWVTESKTGDKWFQPIGLEGYIIEALKEIKDRLDALERDMDFLEREYIIG